MTLLQLFSFPNLSSYSTAVEAATVALQATEDLLSQTKIGQPFKLRNCKSHL